jgi:phosphatidylethanolamine/phosphatidyl-N-methylethanolamine N-methyltransferase
MTQARLTQAGRSASGDLDEGTIRKAYKRWAPVYDLVFGAVFDAGRKKALEALNRHGGHVLEVGVGTGISLPDYRRDMRVTGIDLSHDMLVRAGERVQKEKLRHVDGVSVMDASRMCFKDATFDAAVAMYLITVVPDPEGVLAEMARVVKPGGEVILVNHFGADTGPRAKVEKILAHRSRDLGWRPDFPIERVLRCPDLELVERTSIGAFGMYTLLRFKRRAANDAGAVGMNASIA